MTRPDTTRIEKYSKAKQVELGDHIAHRKKVYLDVRFWIFVRDVMLEFDLDPKKRKLLHFLRRGVEKGRIICPISASIFQEVMKQPFTSERRIATAKLIDELSLGVTMIPLNLVVGTEIHRWLLHRKGEQNIHSMQELIWTKVGNIYGDLYPHWPELSLSADQEFELQRRGFDEIWVQPLTKIIDMLGETNIPSNDSNGLSIDINEQNKIWAHQITNFRAAYDIELRGLIECFSDITAQALQHIVDPADGWPMSSSRTDREAREIGARHLLYDGFTKGDAKCHIRSLHIHASMRTDKERQFKPNDYYDIKHATAALAYWDVFMTEKSFGYLTSRRDLGLEAVNGCKVISDIEEANILLNELSRE